MAIYSNGKNTTTFIIFCSQQRSVLLAKNNFITLKKDEKYETKLIRCRTIGDMTCTGVSESKASTLEEIIDEVSSTRITERGGRADDKRSEAAMEDRKKQGYF